MADEQPNLVAGHPPAVKIEMSLSPKSLQTNNEYQQIVTPNFEECFLPSKPSVTKIMNYAGDNELNAPEKFLALENEPNLFATSSPKKKRSKFVISYEVEPKENDESSTDPNVISLKSLNERLRSIESANETIKKEVMVLSKNVRENVLISKQILYAVNRLIGIENDHTVMEIDSLLPISSPDVLYEIEEKMCDKEFEKSIHLHLLKIKGTSENVEDIFRRIINDECAAQFNWDGRWGKKSLKTLKLFDKILCDLYPTLGKSNFEKLMKKSIEMSHNRYKQAKYIMKRKREEMD